MMQASNGWIVGCLAYLLPFRAPNYFPDHHQKTKDSRRRIRKSEYWWNRKVAGRRPEVAALVKALGGVAVKLDH